MGSGAVAAVCALGEGDANGACQLESDRAGKRTGETVRIGEKLMEALDAADERRTAVEAWALEEQVARDALPAKERAAAAAKGKPLVAPPAPNVMMGGREPVQHVLHALRQIKSAELDETLLLMPFAYATRLLGYLERALTPAAAAAATPVARTEVEIAAKVAVQLLRAHFRQIVATQSLKPSLVRLQALLRSRLYDLQDLFGRNLAACQQIKRQVAEASAQFVE